MLQLIANDEPLEPEWLDHAMKGEWADHRECTSGVFSADISQGSGTSEIVSFVRAGTHAKLFE